MNIVRIHVDGFGKLHNFDLELKEGVNLVVGRNEAGKSTLHLFLRSMFYGVDTKHKNGQPSVFESMRPWKHPRDFGGSLEVSEGEEHYRIDRNFDRAADDLRVTKISGNDKTLLSPEEAKAALQRLLKGLSETAYVNTVSAGQLRAATERAMSGELRKYAANVSSTASPELNADRAIELLQEKRKELEASLDQEAAKEYTGLVSAAKKLEESLDQPGYENNILHLTESGRKADDEAEKLKEQLRGGEGVIRERQELLERYGLTSRELIEETRTKVLQEYGRRQVLEEKVEKGGKSYLALALVVLAAGSGVLAWKFRQEYLFIIFLILAAACLAGALMAMFRQSGNENQLDRLEEYLKEQFTRYTGSGELNDENLHQFENRMFELKTAAGELGDARSRQDALQSDMDRIAEEQRVRRATLDEQREAREKVEDGLRELNSMQAEAAVLRRTLSRNDLIRDRIEAVDVAIETMEQLKESIGSAVGTYINREASRMVEGLTGGAYTSVNAGRQYDISLNSHDGMIPIASVSAGTADQVYLAMRLATIRFITGEEDSVPLILDDSFTLYDDSRLRRAVRFLADNYRGQILIFSCQRREEAALKAEELPYHLAEM